ncbi:FecCD family ABC transporter permease [Macrococcus equipercicus]|uniref:FecCD family ABC transporter permease n=1 Tax=Macrococcus equipercicus TaxID=69967 RepID=UPI00147856C2|nr:iron ABC transporter permease [Macrococcus equipercicus]
MRKDWKHLRQYSLISKAVLLTLLVAVAALQLLITPNGPALPHGLVERAILLDIRLPRLLLGLLAGFILAVTGMVFQTIFNNRLADSFSLGLASGASFGSAVAVVFGLYSLTALSSIAFSVLTLLLVILLTHQLFQGHQQTGMVLFGMFINFFFSSALYGLVLLKPAESRSLLNYLFGSVGAAEWHDIIVLTPVTVLCTSWLLYNARAVAIVSTGDTMATGLGISTTTFVYSVLAVASIMTAVLISMAGIIGFVGLLVPQLWRVPDCFSVRLIWTGLAGSVTVILSDFLGNVILAPVQIPVSIILAFLGLPLLLVITIRTIKTSTIKTE